MACSLRMPILGMTLEKERILESLKQLYDPEIPVDIVNLGLVYDLRIEQGRVSVRVMTTDPGRPVGKLIAAEVERAIREIEGVEEVHVEPVYDPPWSLRRTSEEGRRILGWW